jgi:hypothetical protein
MPRLSQNDISRWNLRCFILSQRGKKCHGGQLSRFGVLGRIVVCCAWLGAGIVCCHGLVPGPLTEDAGLGNVYRRPDLILTCILEIR